MRECWDTLRAAQAIRTARAHEEMNKKKRTEHDELDQAIHGMLRDVHIAGPWNADLGPARRGGHEVPMALFKSSRRGASEHRVSHVTNADTTTTGREIRTGRN